VNSPSPYGTFDQGGNVSEWNESSPSFAYRGRRGGFWSSDETALHATAAGYSSAPTNQLFTCGFRVASAIPEPSAALTCMTGLLALRHRCVRRAGRRQQRVIL
jgi:sulfatase modifying factor 1